MQRCTRGNIFVVAGGGGNSKYLMKTNIIKMEKNRFPLKCTVFMCTCVWKKKKIIMCGVLPPPPPNTSPLMVGIIF